MGDKFFPDTKEPHIHEHGGGIDYTNTKHAHKKLLEGDQLREENCKAVIDDLKAKPTEREAKIIQYVKDLVRKYKKGK